MKKTSYSLQALAQHVCGTVQGDEALLIHGLATLDAAQADQLSFYNNPKYQGQLATTQAGVVILAAKDLPHYRGANALVVGNPYLAYARIAQLYWQRPPAYHGIHPTALLDASVSVGRDVSVGAYAVVAANSVLHDGAVIGAHCVIGEDCQIGAMTQLAARVTLYYGVSLGQRCMVHSGAVLGSDGFGFAPHEGGYEKIPQLGKVVIGDDVEIGANTTIDRGALDDTVIANGVKLDNQIQIGHNVKIGEHTVIAGCTGIAGSADIGAHCMVGGASAIGGHLKIVDRVMLVGMSMVTNSILESGVYASGTGLLPRKEWQKSTVRFRQLDKLARSVMELKKRAEESEGL